MNWLIVIISSSWKFAATFPVAVYVYKMSFVETILYTNIGEIIGIIFFMFFSKGVIHLYKASILKNRQPGEKHKKIVTKRNRRLVIIKQKYGLPGIVFLTPVVISIPIGAFLIVKYYGNTKRNFLFLVLSHFLWSLVYTVIYMKVKIAV